MHCQKCRTPLRLDGSLQTLNAASFKLLADASSASQRRTTDLDHNSKSLYAPERKKLYDEASANATSPVFKRSMGSSSQKDEHSSTSRDPNMSFVMLNESQFVSPVVAPKSKVKDARKLNSQKYSSIDDHSHEGSLLSHQMETSSRLFEILSSRSDIDYPICSDCTDILLQGMESRLAIATRERDAYAEFLRNAHADAPTEEESNLVQQELTKMRAQEQASFEELKKLEAERKALEDEINLLDQESRRLDLEEESFWRESNAFSRTLLAFQNERDSINLRYDHDSKQLEQLQRTNVYNDTFCISHDGSFGTINGLRLGRLSSVTVDWPEINAAWGQACLLLATVATKLDYQFQGYILNPMGSTSSIEKFEQPPRSSVNSTTNSGKTPSVALALYYSSDLPLSLVFLHRNFDNAMIAFLECVRQLGKHAERTTQNSPSGTAGGLRLPYDIKKDKINDCSIKLGGFSGDETWTKACKFTLTCCKFLLAHASNVNSVKKSGE